MINLSKSIQANFYIDSSGYYKETTEPEKDILPVSYLWGLCAMLQAHNEMEKIMIKKALITSTFNIIKKYYDPAIPAAGYASYSIELKGGSRFYDDNQWIGIAAMDDYTRTKKSEWLHTGKEIYQFMMTGYDTVAGGSLY